MTKRLVRYLSEYYNLLTNLETKARQIQLPKTTEQILSFTRSHFDWFLIQ